MKHYLTFVPVLTVLVVCTPGSADTEAGINALGRGQYEQALEAFRPGAEQGDPSDQNLLAHTYTLLENYEEAYAWYHLSAACGSLDAEIELAVLSQKITEETAQAGRTLGETYYQKYCSK